MRTLLLDIETAPNQAFVWGFFQQNISANQVLETSYILCWSAQRLGSREILFDSVQHSSRKTMLGRIHKLLDEADTVVTYNGRKFDLPVLNREFVKHGFKPPSPYKQVDLYQVCKHTFRFESNRLDFITQALEIGAKVRHSGFELWVRCMQNDPAAWRAMERYNRQDVRLLERLYKRLRPWIVKHPNLGAHDDHEGCPKCGSQSYQQRGYAVTAAMKYRRYQCKDCGGWFRGNKSVSPKLPAGKERHLNIVS